jgi:Rrf2 family protein
MLALKRAKYVRSSKGRQGGYQLAKPAHKITLAEIVRSFDGAIASTESVSEHFYEPTPIEKEDKLVHVFREIRDHVAEKLETTTIGDML